MKILACYSRLCFKTTKFSSGFFGDKTSFELRKDEKKKIGQKCELL
jgi:hypothetical protein